MGYLRVILMASCAFLPVAAQSVYSEILGLVTDPSGAAVQGAQVTIKNLETGAQFPTTSGVDGAFRVRQLNLGSYQISVEKSGFAKYIQGPIA